ncbi:hypothetical protein Aab01nite_04310 [Paractinoplanes abujensis]|uniref:DNA-binding MarR family transcriptional regulator n=1 Tax=Paractinoplanes abujensis TaxID=882441 RepID=A0A7W7CND3_9ACTN|nr:MarR family transcriptional regulator [Actinoplanes abujensis]MBB4691737.1 DNA-binding MarR family transcriptional regulator [Actinoplanes abujensis]GID16841.1 hypothetical protein Aab01nite_04310 [Actinoplanes abujensis]
MTTQLGVLLAGAGLTMRSAFTPGPLAGGPVNQQALIDLLGVDPSALVTVLNELEGAGLVSRQRDPADRGRHIVVITARGSRVLEEAEKVLDKAGAALFAALDAAGRDQLQRLLSKVADSGSRAGKC